MKKEYTRIELLKGVIPDSLIVEEYTEKGIFNIKFNFRYEDYPDLTRAELDEMVPPIVKEAVIKNITTLLAEEAKDG